MVTVYSKNDCNPCRMTKEFLRRHGIPFVDKNIEDSEENLMEAIKFGIKAMPIVVAPGHKPWGGLNRQALDSLLGP